MDAKRYRLVYEKTGPTAFLSHLDLIRAIPRTFRRVGLELHYSAGFHPKPDMTFGPALSLSVASLSEVIDLKLIGAMPDMEAMATQLNEASPEGLRFVHCIALGPRDPAVNRVLDAATYAVGVPRHAIAELGGEAWLAAKIADLAAAPSRVVVRSIDGVGKKVDVKLYTRAVLLNDADAAASLFRAGYVGDLIPLRIEVDITGAGAVKVSEVIEAIGNGTDIPFRAVRSHLGKRAVDGSDRVISPAELDLLRTPLRTSTGDAKDAPADDVTQM